MIFEIHAISHLTAPLHHKTLQRIASPFGSGVSTSEKRGHHRRLNAGMATPVRRCTNNSFSFTRIGIACTRSTFYILHVIDLIQRVPIFAGLEDEALRSLLEHTEKREFEEDAIVACEGEACNKLFIIGSGSVRLFKHFGKSQQIEIATLGVKDFIGESCILDTLPRMATVVAASPTTVFTISSMAFHHLYQKMPAQHSILLLNIARDLSRRIRALDEVYAARH